MSIKKSSLIRFFVAAVVYAAFAWDLYSSYFRYFDRWQYLIVFNVCLASLGCYVLSRRWVAGFAESFFAGAIYGFGPFLLGLTKFHPTAGFLAAVIPWLFCPAAFGFKEQWRVLRILLGLLPFMAIVVFFQASTHYRLFPVSIQTRLHPADLTGLFAPLVTAKLNQTLIGFYHIPIAALVIGFCMLLAVRRYSVMIIIALGVVLSFCDAFNSYVEVSPIMWLTVPVLCCSVLIAEGMQGLASAGFADRVWILVTTAVMAALAILTLLLATKYFQTFLGLGSGYAKLFTAAGKMYVLGAIVAAIIFFMIRAKLRMQLLRRLVLCVAMAIDIFIGARYIVDRIL
ncbi:MAG: hypothetical protein GY774_35820 [Planctomycetes bacterium]|nr:hypothetical protein [Planctomycetota bacterium]